MLSTTNVGPGPASREKWVIVWCYVHERSMLLVSRLLQSLVLVTVEAENPASQKYEDEILSRLYLTEINTPYLLLCCGPVQNDSGHNSSQLPGG